MAYMESNLWHEEANIITTLRDHLQTIVPSLYEKYIKDPLFRVSCYKAFKHLLNFNGW